MNAALTFPLLTLGKRLHVTGNPGGETLDYVVDAEEFSTLSIHDLKSAAQVGKVLIGTDGRRWKILSVADRGVGSPWKIWWILGLFFGFLHRVEYEFLELETWSLDQIKDWVITIVKGSPDEWGFEEDSEPLEGTLDDFVADLRDAPDVVQIINELFHQNLV